jgi:hypothetical protein
LTSSHDRVLSAAELLESRGWQVVTFGQERRVAYLRNLAC